MFSYLWIYLDITIFNINIFRDWNSRWDPQLKIYFCCALLVTLLQASLCMVYLWTGSIDKCHDIWMTLRLLLVNLTRIRVVSFSYERGKIKERLPFQATSYFRYTVKWQLPTARKTNCLEYANTANLLVMRWLLKHKIGWRRLRTNRIVWGRERAVDPYHDTRSIKEILIYALGIRAKTQDPS